MAIDTLLENAISLPTRWPWLTAIVIYCLATWSVNAIFKKHTDEDLVAMAERTKFGAMLIRLCRSVGFDPTGFFLFLRRLAASKAGSPPSLPRPPALPVLFLAGALACLGLGCKDSKVPLRHWEVRGAVLTMSVATDAAAATCLRLPADTTKALDCFDHVDRARKAQKRAEDLLDAWEVSQASLKCAGIAWADALLADVDVFLASGVKVPALVEDGIAAAEVLAALEGESCELPPPADAANDNGYAPIADGGTDGG